ncbi:hypothetical protein BC835DRAFT_1357627 [Cytidiella melzeri]|nr:hypothetical protein BC835DRAFT_1357627 [Cytidiella melzeri]
MTEQTIQIDEAEEDESHLSTPIVSYQAILSSDGAEEHDDDTEVTQSSVVGYGQPVKEDATNTDPRVITLPVPSSSQSEGQSTDALPAGHPTTMSVSLDSLPAEAAAADITIGMESRFVETSSGTVARELKRLYDQHIGAGKDASVRSPFVITSFTNQHGKQMYRVGRRDMDRAPRGDTDDLDLGTSRVQSTSAESIASGSLVHTKRRSRYSFFKNGPTQPTPKTSIVQDEHHSPPSRRLRKTRSIPNMASLPDSDPAASPITPTHITGRPHAHSVSSVDAFRPASLPPPAMDPMVQAGPPDVFASVMAWNTMPVSPLSSGSGLRSTRSFYDQPSHERSSDTIQHPFGRGIMFDSPIRTSPSHLTSPPVLREMQSFESGLTARAEPSSKSTRLGNRRGRLSDDSITITGEAFLEELGPVGEPQPAADLHTETVYSRFSTDLFDVLQNYKGLPVLDKVADIPDPPTIKLSLKADDNAVPRDDPRFVIWGEVEGEDVENTSASRSATDLASVHSSLSRRKSTRERQSAAIMDHPTIQTPSSESPKRVLVAATIERWIAQLTSELNYDELLIFFLTYRTYVSALDLGHLLICRFHWALGTPHSPQDDMVRRIVRARTFIAIRYWLLTFFSADFVPNRDLRLLFTEWLNALRKDPVLLRHKDALSIVQKLRKVAMDCKDGYTRGLSARKQSVEKTNLPSAASVDFSQGDFAENLRKAVGKGDDDADIDLDFVDVQGPGVGSALDLGTSPSGNPATAVDLAMMRQPLHLRYLQLGVQNAISADADSLQRQLSLPVPHGALSRAVVNAIGRLGRWKRVLNYRTINALGAPNRPPLGFGSACIDASSFDIDGNETGDLLLERGGVEKYLKMLETQSARRPPPGRSLIHALSVPPPLGLVPGIVSASSASATSSTLSGTSLEPLTETPDESTSDESRQLSAEKGRAPSARSSGEIESVQFRHSFSDTASTTKSPRGVDVVSIDDLDLSDLSTEDLHASPPHAGLRKMARRLPNRRDFELVRRSTDSVSSMGLHTNTGHESILSAGSSVTSSVSVGLDTGGGPIHGWQMNALVDSLSDDEEPGDVEAALRRLEGQISRDKQKQKQSKVDAWVRSINRQQPMDSRLDAELQRYSSDEEDYGEVQSSLRGDRLGQAPDSRASSRSSVSSAMSPTSPVAPVEVLGPAVPPGLGDALSVTKVANSVPGTDSTEHFPPLSQAITSPSAADHPSVILPKPLALSSGGGTFVMPEKNLKRHRSFVLQCRSEDIVQTFSIIDRELFLSLKFEELISAEWMSSTADYNVLDWHQFIRERHEMKVERHLTVPALTVIRSRFNLVANFVASEIVLTHPTERPVLYAKFGRIAWKAYNLRNYHLVVAVFAGLDSVWAQKAMKQTQAKKPGIWKSRVLRNLRTWATSKDDFIYIRQAVDALAEARSQTVSSPEPSLAGAESQPATSRGRAASEGKPPAPPSCVPFFGIYLSQLHRFNSLPDLIDPTAPHEPVGMDLETGALDSPAHPEVFSYLAPLPPSVQLEPLINVHKQRLIATVVKSFVTAQHLATKVEYEPDRKLFQKCLRLRGLEPHTLQRLLALYSGWES